MVPQTIAEEETDSESDEFVIEYVTDDEEDDGDEEW